MALVLWAPVLVPLLPSLLQQWATKVHNGVSETASVLGLYGAVLILITIWGKRVRGYEKPLVQYGLSLFSRKKLQDVARGIAVGAALVTMLYSTNAVLGYVQFRWASLLATNIRFGGMGASKDTLCKQLLDCCNISSCWVWFFPLGTEFWNFVLQSLLRDCRIVYFHSHEDQQNFGASSGDGLCSCAC
jgi:hypothetical protein